MKKLIIILSLFFFLHKICFAVSEKDANEFVVNIGNQAIKILKIPVDDKEKRKNELQVLIEEKFDMPFIAKIILGKKTFKGISDEKFKTFSKVFKLHIVKVYSSQLGTYNGQKFLVTNTEIKKKDAFVYSTIASPEYPTTNIVWRVRKRENGLRVIDMQVEGVSLLRTKRNDFEMILKSQGIDGLIVTLQSMNQMPDMKIPGE
jgi:phospholipid transport system substrate-binding protein